MGKWIDKSLAPPVAPESENHPTIEDIARLAEGTVGRTERETFFRHLNRCQRCYEILQQTIKDAPLPGAAHTAHPWWKTKAAVALAASILIIFIFGGQLAYKYWSQGPAVLSATLELNQELKEILLIDDALLFGKGARLNRLVAVLQQNGLQIKDLSLVVLSKPYYQKKSLFGPKEVLHIRIENDVAYLEVRETD